MHLDFARLIILLLSGWLSAVPIFTFHDLQAKASHFLRRFAIDKAGRHRGWLDTAVSGLLTLLFDRYILPED